MKAKINNLLGTNEKFEKFYNIPDSDNIPEANDTDQSEIKSVFSPKVIIGDGSGGKKGRGFGSMGDYSSWDSNFKNDGFKFDDSMNPESNLWGDEHSYYNSGYQQSNKKCNDKSKGDDWTQNLDDYNKGKWSGNLYKKPSDYVDYYTPNSYGTHTPDSNSSNSTKDTFDDDTRGNNSSDKKCGKYTDLDEEYGDIKVNEYKQSKTFHPGYTYVPPKNWDVPQKHVSVCGPNMPSARKLTGLVDRGLPLNVLELNPDGSVADSEDSVSLTNVGSMLPKFYYQEQPFSKPYI